jgi:hypothetical protein
MNFPEDYAVLIFPRLVVAWFVLRVVWLTTVLPARRMVGMPDGY